MERERERGRDIPREARTCSPKCAVKILDTILPFVLRDLEINLCRLRRTKKNASPNVTTSCARARAMSVWIKLGPHCSFQYLCTRHTLAQNWTVDHCRN